MIIHISNIGQPEKNYSINKNLFIDIILGIVCGQDKQHLISQSNIKKRLKIAVESLHHQTIDTRLQGILELERLALAHCQHNWEIIEILTAFVRQNSPHKENKEIHPDIQASLNVITRRDIQKPLESAQIDLSYTDLRGANLSGANLAGANLYQVNLSGVNLAGANLRGAILSAANLSEANLVGANLAEAIISAANLSQANLAKANLFKANFYLANLSQTNLQDAILDGANLREAKFSG
ncbi:pentapeptide repeat-containing protein [Nostoc sp. LEGE 06077]|uniref:pentapeptide repeat-containing protein n=1 Tax=Nostoc sp. LEGE 06077 TaxID=915325 RepID=UPI001882970A|nr:pentapeptide repeat-containing protein [Nostoc sp. LEGE 06077]MBE9208854.1 pentapeptide repeat-containing protein [Nostoc sp. LEGE 06077]